MTQLIIENTLELFEPHFCSREHPKELFSKVQSQFLEGDSIFIHMQKSVADTRYVNVWQLSQQEALLAQQGFGLFNPTRRRAISDWQFERFNDLNINDGITNHLEHILDACGDEESLSHLRIMPMPIDPSHRPQMMYQHGLLVLPSEIGELIVAILPTDDNLSLLPAHLTRGVIHNLRQAHFAERALDTVADWLMMEGLAATIAEQLYPQDFPMWQLLFREPEHWEVDLKHLAELAKIDDYRHLPVNIYGGRVVISDDPHPAPQALDADEFAYSIEVIQEQLMATDALTIAACLFGDEVIGYQGYQGVGLSPYTGFEIGYQWIHRYCDQHNLQPLDCLRLPTSELLDA